MKKDTKKFLKTYKIITDSKTNTDITNAAFNETVERYKSSKCTNKNIARYISVDKETINKILDEVFIETRM